MPDSSEQKLESELDRKVTKNLPPTNPINSIKWPRKLRIVFISFIVILAIFFISKEIYLRSNYVYAEDSRVEADMITVSSRVAGWVTAIDVTEGSVVIHNQILFNI